MARTNPDRPVVFVAIGFETTAPTVAASMTKAREEEVDNFYVLSLLKLTPPVIRALLDLGEVKLDGIIGPGHVSVIIGTRPYEFIPRDYGIACVISGFEPLDILLGIDRLVEQIERHRPKVEIAYCRGVRPEGNTSALRLMNEVFQADTANWRGIGSIPESGLRISDRYASFDAARAFPVNLEPAREPQGCICGDVLRGVATPPQCKLFGRACIPERPVGPCMVSSEGACAAYYQFADVESIEAGS
jgi:hydrogenase expression/formation protein HypD